LERSCSGLKKKGRLESGEKVEIGSIKMDIINKKAEVLSD